MTAAHARESLRTLLGGIVDYAGLFPPAGLDMPAAVANYAAYRQGTDAWALGRFVLPAARLEAFEKAFEKEKECEAAPRAGAEPWRLSALLGPDVAGDVERVRSFNGRNAGRAVIDALELTAHDLAALERAARSLPTGTEAYAELPVDADVRALVVAAGRTGLRAKVRTGGVTADAFPTSAQLARFIAACVEAGVPFKATAGLHHPLRAVYRFTYEPGSATGTMFGFLNVFLAAALLCAGGPVSDAQALLEETDASAFDITDDAIAWRGHRFDVARLAAARGLAVSFGSCSFREPIEELRAISETTEAGRG